MGEKTNWAEIQPITRTYKLMTTNLKITDFPLTGLQVRNLTKQYDVTPLEMEVALEHIEASVDLTDDVDIRYLLHHMFNYVHKIKAARYPNRIKRITT